MRAGTLGTSKETEQHINIPLQTKPIRQKQLRGAAKLREVVEEHIQTHLHAGIIELVQT